MVAYWKISGVGGWGLSGLSLVKRRRYLKNVTSVDKISCMLKFLHMELNAPFSWAPSVLQIGEN